MVQRPRQRHGRTGRNDPCPCGSGRKHKHCCLGRGVDAVPYTQEERGSALARLEEFVAEELGPEDDAAWESFFGRWRDDLERLDEEQTELSDAVFDMWFYLDCALDDGRRAVDLFLEAAPPLAAGERRYLELLRESTVRFYDVVDAVPGSSLTLRDLVTRRTLVVRERLGSQSIPRHTLLAARVVARGASGEPEMERGVLAIPELLRHEVLGRQEADRERWRREHRGADEAEFDRLTPPFAHDAWIACILEPPVPRLHNTDGEDVLLTRVRFDVADAVALERALDAEAALAREEDGRTAWGWSGRNPRGDEVSLGRIVLDGSSLTLECNSKERGDRGRALVEGLGAGGVSHRATSHENLAAAVRERMRRGGPTGARAAGPAPEIPREVQEALVLEHCARHYRRWIDEKIPALDGHTPREAAVDAALRPTLVDLIEGLENVYQRALQRGDPAYDPSWMWDELGLDVRPRPVHPPPLAHERLAAAVPGLAEVCATVAASMRSRPGFDEVSAVVSASDLASNVQARQFFRSRAGEAAEASSSLADDVRTIVNYELHRRKTFWVDEALAYMLAKTDTTVPGRDLRVPFASFALAFTDRQTLSLGERLLSLERSSRAGHFLRVATVYVTEERRAEGRVLHMALALDPLGADPPHVRLHEVPLEDDAPVQRFLEGVAPFVASDPPVADWHPLRGLLQVALNAVLYATSAGVEPRLRAAPSHAKPKGTASPATAPAYSSESVFFLPGAIEISQVRRMQELERAPTGRGFLHRFMVRGHWRRAPEGWKDQRMRWIEPYWKGPDLAAIVERAYKLTP